MSAPALDRARIRAITLDLDETLWPVWPTIEHAESQLRAWLDTHAPRTGALARDPEAARAARRAVLTARPDIAHDLGTQRREAIRHLLMQAGDDAALAEPAFEVFHAARQRVTLFADALPALEFLSARFPLVALSNGNADVRRVGLGRYFHAAVAAHEVGAAKPDIRIFEAGARAAGVPAAQVLHVGDDPHLDSHGALAAGMQTVWVNRQGVAWPGMDSEPAAQPHAVVADLGALCALLTNDG